MRTQHTIPTRRIVLIRDGRILRLHPVRTSRKRKRRVA